MHWKTLLHVRCYPALVFWNICLLTCQKNSFWYISNWEIQLWNMTRNIEVFCCENVFYVSTTTFSAESTTGRNGLDSALPRCLGKKLLSEVTALHSPPCWMWFEFSRHNPGLLWGLGCWVRVPSVRLLREEIKKRCFSCWPVFLLCLWKAQCPQACWVAWWWWW